MSSVFLKRQVGSQAEDGFRRVTPEEQKDLTSNEADMERNK